MSAFKLTTEHLERMWIPEVHWHATLDKIPEEPAHKKEVRSFVENIDENVRRGQGLYLWGDYGRGKSALGSICLKAAASRGHIGLWIRAKELPDYIINDVWFDDWETVIRRARTVPLLVIDEFQIRKEVKFTETTVEDLIRYRIDGKLSTVVTSNVTIKTLESDYPALYSVLHEALLPLHVRGYDFRADKKGRV